MQELKPYNFEKKTQKLVAQEGNLMMWLAHVPVKAEWSCFVSAVPGGCGKAFPWRGMSVRAENAKW